MSIENEYFIEDIVKEAIYKVQAEITECDSKIESYVILAQRQTSYKHLKGDGRAEKRERLINSMYERENTRKNSLKRQYEELRIMLDSVQTIDRLNPVRFPIVSKVTEHGVKIKS